MTPSPTKVADLQALGYECGIAHGDVAVEQDALATAQANAQPTVVVNEAADIAASVLRQMDTDGKLPSTDEGRAALAAAIGQAALDMVAARADANVDFHQRALDAAESMPTVWHVGGYGISLYLSCEEDGTGSDSEQQAALDSIADPDAHAERVYLYDHPDEVDAASTLVAAGHTVTRPTPGADTWDIDGEPVDGAALIAAAENPS
jgi:hypothetical protein